MLRPENQIIGVRYYTARVSGRIDRDAPRRQQVYFDTLSTVPEISLHMGSFLAAKKFSDLIHTPSCRPPLATPWPAVVRVHKAEAKGSDVNLASHLLLNAFRNDYDVAAVISNDTTCRTDPNRNARTGKSCGLLSPVPNPAPQLKAYASLVRHINTAHLLASQFPDPVVAADGTVLAKTSDVGH